MKVLIVLGQRPGFTGSGVLVKELWQCGARLGDEFELLCSGYEGDRLEEDFGLKHSIITFSSGSASGELPFPIPGMSDVMPYKSVRYADLSEREVTQFVNSYRQRLDRLLERFQPDVVHVHHLWVLVALIESTRDVPCVVTVHGTDLKLAKSAPQHRRLVTKYLPQVRHFLCVSRDIARDACGEYGLHRSQLTVIGNGFNEQVFSTKGSKQEAVGHVVLCAGKFVAWKGFRFVVRACALLRATVQLVILGTGSTEEQIELTREIEAHSVNARLPGHLSHAEVARWMRRADVFVLPSLHEPFGLVLLEAMACGCRVVASGSGGPLDVISPELLQGALASLVRPLSGLSDEERYVRDLAKAIEFHLEGGVSSSDRETIAASVESRTWDNVYQLIRARYEEAVRG